MSHGDHQKKKSGEPSQLEKNDQKINEKECQEKLQQNNPGMSSIWKIKEDFVHGLRALSETEVVQKTTAAFRSIEDTANKAFEETRQSNTVKAFEEKVGSVFSSVQNRVNDGVEGKADEAAVDKASDALYPDLQKERVEELLRDSKKA